MNKLKNLISKNQLLILLLFIPLVSFIAISVIFTDNSKVWVFPFNVEIWGTVSDWFMVWVTAITAIYLIKTFKEQQRITQIENFNYIERIKPKFQIEISIDEFKFDSDGITGIAKGELVIFNSNHTAYNITISLEKPLDYFHYDFGLPKERYNVLYENDKIFIPNLIFKIDESVIIFNDSMDKKLNQSKQEEFWYSNKFILEFFDAENNKYFQTLTFHIFNDEKINSFASPVSDKAIE